jgi:hypothetical protein
MCGGSQKRKSGVAEVRRDGEVERRNYGSAEVRKSGEAKLRSRGGGCVNLDSKDQIIYVIRHKNYLSKSESDITRIMSVSDEKVAKRQL